MYQEGVIKKKKLKYYEISNFDSFTTSGSSTYSRGIQVKFTVPPSVVDLRGKTRNIDYFIICTELAFDASFSNCPRNTNPQIKFNKISADVTIDGSGNASISKSCGVTVPPSGSSSARITNINVTKCKIRIYVYT